MSAAPPPRQHQDDSQLYADALCQSVIDGALRCHLFAQAEIAEDDVEEILDIDAAGDPPEAAPGKPQILGPQFRQIRRERAAQRGQGRLQRLAVPRASPGRVASNTKSRNSASSARFKARRNPSCSMTSALSRNPAVSASTMG